MNIEISAHERAIQEQAALEEQMALQEHIEREQRKLAALEDEVRAVDMELDALAAQREKYELLDQICSAR